MENNNEEVPTPVGEEVQAVKEDTTNDTEDRHTSEESITNFKKLDTDSVINAVLLPTSTYNKIDKLIDIINDMGTDKFTELYSTAEATTTGINIQSMGLGIKDDVLSSSVSDTDSMVNNIEYGDKNLSMSYMPIKSTGKLSGSSAVAKFSSKVGIGEYTQVPLWHSGIWVTLKPPKDSDIINLEIAISNNEIKLGRETNTLIYSNYTVILVRIVTDFVINHIVNTSIELDPSLDIRDYIKVQDLQALVIGLVSSMYPDGYSVVRNCVNSLNTADNKPTCDYGATGEVIPIKLLRPNRKSLTPSMLKHMSMKRPNSTTVDSVKEYQLSLKENKPRIVHIKTSNNTDIDLTISSPSLSTYIDNGEEWVENIITKTQELFTESSNEDEKNRLVKDTLSAVILGIYNIYVTKIVSDDDIVETAEDISDVLDMLSGDKDMLKQYVDAIKEYIGDSSMAVVAIPTYVCPTCVEKGNSGEQSDETAGVFKEFIPINVLEHFFDLSAFRTSLIRKRNIS